MVNIKIQPLKINKINQFINQTNNSKGVYNSIWKLKDFVESLKFTSREPLNYNLFEDGSNLFNQEIKKYPEFNTDYYQRLINDEKTKKVILFLLKELKLSIDNPTDYLVTFPTSLIFSLYTAEQDSFDEYKTFLESKDFNDDSFNENIGIYKNNETIYLPNINILLVVDGQHRLAGLLAIYYSLLSTLGENKLKFNQKLIDFAGKNILKEGFSNLRELIKVIENFEFNCTILLDFDVWEQGKVFADVNFNQKPVNKSLYYDIFGSYPDTENNDLYIAHHWAVYLNNEKISLFTKLESPFLNKIKMLGNGDGYISQAFLVESIFPLLRKNGIWNDFLVNNFGINITSNRPMYFLETYFNVIKDLFPEYWPINDTKPSTYKNILFKTTGLSALFMLIKDIYPKVEDFVYKDNYDELYQKISNEFIDNNKKLRIDGEKLFSKDGDFSKGAGKGLQMRLYKRIAFDLGYRKTID